MKRQGCLGEKHGDVFKGVLCEVGYRLRRFPPLDRSFADAEDLRRRILDAFDDTGTREACRLTPNPLTAIST